MPLLLLLASPSLAATLTVGSSGSYSTVQSAVNAASTGDTITIAAGTYTEDVDTKGKDLTLVGAGSSKVTIDASGNDSALTVDKGETVTVQGVSLTGSDQGVNVVGSTLTVSDLDIYGMTGDSAGGGFLLSDGAIVDVSDTLVRGIKVGNSAYGGAVFASDSSASFTDCTFKNNQSYQGGAFYSVNSTLEITDSSIWGNESTLKGGGLQIRQGSSATLLRVEIYENSSDDQGGGINVEDSDLSCQNCSITDNQAGDSGGGVAVDGALSSGVSFTGKNSVISGNSAVGAGGGLYVWDAKLTLGGELSDNTVSGSSARGAGLYYGKNKLNLTDLNISGHKAV
ncbi:MAG: putative outer membrane repeat protein, partial [Cognaticolwellia sp.]